MPVIKISDLNNAKVDTDHIADVATSTAPTATDRMGNVKRTVKGAIDYIVSVGEAAMAPVAAAAAAAITSVQNATAAAIASTQSAANTAITTVQNATTATITATQTTANAAISAIRALVAAEGYQVPTAYAAGIALTQPNQTVSYGGNAYAPIESELPFTTSGTFESGKFRLIQGVSGADLASPFGGEMVGTTGGTVQAALDGRVKRGDLSEAVDQEKGAALVGYRRTDVATSLRRLSAQLPQAPLENVILEPEVYRVVDSFGGRIYATGTGGTFVSDDAGESYSHVVAKSGIGLIPTADGEMLMLNSDRIERSSGWSVNPATATWANVVSLPVQAQSTYFLRWGFDGDGQKFIATCYGNGGAIYRVWISVDAGQTFTVAFDQSTSIPDNPDRSHFHAACYDPWDDRFYFCYGHGAPTGIYYSDDDGTTWTKMVQYSHEFEGVAATFTTMTATDFGIVCGTDLFPNGIYILRRSKNPDSIKLELAGRWDTPRGGLLGFADRGYRDPETGIVYVSFKSDWADVAPVIFACGSHGAEVIYTAALTSGQTRRIQNVVVSKGQLVASLTNPSQTVRGNISDFSAVKNPNRGNVFTSSDTPVGSVAVGPAAIALASASVAIGYNATVDYNIVARDNSVAVGHTSRVIGVNGVAVGRSSRAGIRSVAIGAEATTAAGDTGSQNNAVAVGYQATAPQNYGVALGMQANAVGAGGTSLGALANSAGSATAVGFAANAAGDNSVAVGNGAKAGGLGTIVIGTGNPEALSTYAVAIGIAAKANHVEAVALGRNTQTLRASSVCVGTRDIESTKAGGGIYLKSPNGSLYKVSVNDAGALAVVATA